MELGKDRGTWLAEDKPRHPPCRDSVSPEPATQCSCTPASLSGNSDGSSIWKFILRFIYLHK